MFSKAFCSSVRLRELLVLVLVLVCSTKAIPDDGHSSVSAHVSDDFKNATMVHGKHESCDRCGEISTDCQRHPTTSRDGHSGRSQAVAWYAVPSVNPRYLGYYVGGGAVARGEGRCTHEGVWGLDFRGGLIKRRVRLDWWHGHRYQGGTGAYKTDGPHVIKTLTAHN